MDPFSRTISQLNNAGRTWSFQDLSSSAGLSGIASLTGSLTNSLTNSLSSVQGITDDIHRYEVRPGDYWNGVTTAERSETGSTIQWAQHQNIDLSYQFMVEPGAKNTAAWMVMGQFVSSPGPGGKTWSPPFAVEMVGETMRLVVRSSTDKIMTTNPNPTVIWQDKAPIERGHYYDMDVKITFDPNGNGSVVVTRDGVQLVNYHGAVGYTDSGGQYWKEGIYRAPSNTTIAADYSHQDIHYTSVTDDGTLNVINGTSANESLWGTGHADSIVGGAGDDRLYGHDGNDILMAGDGRDTLYGMSGADRMDGGAGTDTADYSLSSAGVTISVDGSVGSGGDAQGDVLTNIELLTGSDYDDKLTGGVGWNYLTGAGGNDWLDGGLNGDTLDGGDGYDTADYSRSSAAVTVSLFDNKGHGGSADADLLISIENLQGSKFNDILIGNGGANTLSGGDGNDVIYSGGGADAMFGGAGNDVFFGGKGNDTADGGAGSDCFVFAGKSSEYAFSFTDDGKLQVTDKVAGRGGTDVLSDIEYLSFKDGTTAVADISTSQTTRIYNTSWQCVGYDITTKAGSSVQYKHYDANWKMTGSESVTTLGDTVTTRHYDANSKQTGVEVDQTIGGHIVEKLYDASFTKLLSTQIESLPGQTTQQVVNGSDRVTTTTFDDHGKRIAVDVQTIESSGTVVKHYDGAMHWMSNTIYVDRGTSLDIKQYDASWHLTSYINNLDETLSVGDMYTDKADSMSMHTAVSNALSQVAGTADDLASYANLGHWHLG